MPRAAILALVIAVTGSAAVLQVPLRTGNETRQPTGEIESARMREIEALLDSTRRASAICTSAPAKSERQSK
jgi:hypothetical protein